MGKRATDLTGQCFGDLVVLLRAGTDGKNVRWQCACKCGRTTTVLGQNLRNGSVKSCGCGAHPTTHGASGTRLYHAWASMHARCRSRSYHARAHYADKGISVCEEWSTFEAFRDWALDNGYADKLTLDRIGNTKGYAPDNCRFITIADQQRNKSNHRLITYEGETLPLHQWAERFDLAQTTLHQRLTRGWSVARALTTPARRPT